MTPERWQHIARIYDLVIDHDPATRAAFLAEACAEDDDLRREVASLLEQDATPALVDGSLWATAAPIINDGPDPGPTLGPGAVLGPYQIEAPIGAGGMGEVFRAMDIRLNRRVALKLLPPGVALDEQMRARLNREARAVAALAHPNICTLYDVGSHRQVDFLVMEHLDGETLAARLAGGALSLDDALTHAITIASALDHAHRHGIVHRDLKPANIMLTASGAKLLDFGLAKVRSGAAGGPEPGVSRSAAGAHDPVRRLAAARGDRDGSAVTEHGTILGTLRYMAPEQIEGREVDARSDLFSFGAVLFEMLTGTPAFPGDNPAQVRSAILESEPPAVSSLQPAVPVAVDRILRRCFARDPRARWQSGGDLIGDLRLVLEFVVRARPPARANVFSWQDGPVWAVVAGFLSLACIGLVGAVMADRAARSASGPPSARVRSIAVLPIENLSGDGVEDYFADGMTEQLIADLAKIRELHIISPVSVMRYKNARKAAPVVAQELRVDAVVEASVVSRRDRARITARLIRGTTGDVIWARSYERDLRDVLALQRDVARAIASQLHITLTPQDQARLASARPVDPEVHRQVLLGRHNAAKGTEEALRKAVEHFDRAIAVDPANALAYAGLAEAYTALSSFYIHPREGMPKAKRAAETAVRLDAGLADGYAALGYIHLIYDWDGPSAEKTLLRALDLNPTLAPARLSYAAYLTTQGRNEEAIEEIRRAVALDPLSIQTHSFGTLFLLFTRRYDEAIELARKGLELQSDSALTLAFQGAAYAEQHRFKEAIANLQRAAQLDNSPTILALYAHVLAVAGETDRARELLRQVEKAIAGRYFCPYEIGTVFVSLGDRDTAYKWFRKGAHDRADCMPWLGVEPWIDPFRTDPRYATLLREIGLDPVSR